MIPILIPTPPSRDLCYRGTTADLEVLSHSRVSRDTTSPTDSPSRFGGLAARLESVIRRAEAQAQRFSARVSAPPELQRLGRSYFVVVNVRKTQAVAATHFCIDFGDVNPWARYRLSGTFGGTYVVAAEPGPAPIPSHPEWCYCREASTCGNGEGG
jgi:hypothetical protein